MKKLFTSLLLILTLNINAQENLNWHTDVNKAIELSVKTNKPLFFFFTGSDWCGWCIRLQKAVFSKPEFEKWANESVILVELDFPRRTKISEDLQKQNREIANMFGVRGYPTIWLVNPKTENEKTNLVRLGTLGASPLEVKSWIAGANRIIANK